MTIEAFSRGTVWHAVDDVERKENSDGKEAQLELSERRLESALRGAAAGLRVVPLIPGTKRPILPRIFDIATTDTKTIEKWAKDYPGCNFSFVMGEKFCVLDIDVKRKGHDGFESLKQLSPKSPTTFRVQTPSGGMHFYYWTNGHDLASKSGSGHGWYKGIDFLSKGKLCLVPYCQLEGGRVYEPSGSLHNAEPVPQWLLDALHDGKHTPKPPQRVFVRSARRGETSPSAASLSDISSLLDRIDPDVEYDNWLKVIFAVLNVLDHSEESTDLVLQWSKSGKKWDENEFCKKVNSYNPDHPTKLGVPYLRSVAIGYSARPLTEIPVDELPAAEILRLSETHLEYTIDALTKLGNKPDECHKAALRLISRRMVQGLFSSKGRFRHVYPLETGMGKTTSIVMLCKLISDSALPKSMVIFVETVRQGHELKTWIDAVVAGQETGLLHAVHKHETDFPSIPAADAQNRRFLIACHNRAKTASQYNKVDQLLTYKGKKRDLIIWDETLSVTKGLALAAGNVVDAASLWQGQFNLQRNLGGIASESEYIYREVDDFLARAKETITGGRDKVIAIAPPRNLTVYRDAIREMLQKTRLPRAVRELLVDSLMDLVEFATRGPMRIAKVGHDLAMLQFQETLDDSFAKMIVLDASAKIGKSLRRDTSIEVASLLPTKDYSNVKILHADILSSKSSFNSDPSHLSDYAAELGHLLVDTIPGDDDVLVICYKERLEEVRNLIEELGLSRGGAVHVTTWGRHRGTNEFANCKWLFCFGVPYLSEPDLAAMVVAQEKALDCSIAQIDITQNQHSQQADTLYQAISRGNSRNTLNGKAGEQTVYLLHPRKDSIKVLELLRQVMPGVLIAGYEPAVLRTRQHRATGNYRKVGDAIVAFVKAMPEEHARVSLKRIHASSWIAAVNSNSPTFRRGRKYATEVLAEDWAMDGQTFVRRPKEG